jgi:hypothetical protein
VGGDETGDDGGMNVGGGRERDVTWRLPGMDGGARARGTGGGWGGVIGLRVGEKCGSGNSSESVADQPSGVLFDIASKHDTS